MTSKVSGGKKNRHFYDRRSTNNYGLSTGYKVLCYRTPKGVVNVASNVSLPGDNDICARIQILTQLPTLRVAIRKA